MTDPDFPDPVLQAWEEDQDRQAEHHSLIEETTMYDYDHTLDADPVDYDYDAAFEEDRDRQYDRWLASGRDPQEWEDWMEDYEDSPFEDSDE